MQATVALVQARPETILEDYRRVMELAGLGPSNWPACPFLLAGQDRAGWFPGNGCPPWQLDGVLQALGGGPSDANFAASRQTGSHSGDWQVVAVDPAAGGLLGPARGWVWEEVLARRGAAQSLASDLDRTPFHSQSPLPALTSALPDGLSFPPSLQGRPALLLPVPRMLPGWPLAGSVALLMGLHGRLRRNLKVPLSEVRAEGIAMARELFPKLGVVMDATMWSIARGNGYQAVARNVLLAGDDPVAVDATAARLAGLDPRSIPWLRLCGERNLGAVAESDIHLKGSRELLDLDFQVSPDTLGTESMNPLARSDGGLLWRFWRKPMILKKHKSSPWGRLFQDYQEYRSGEVGRGRV